MNILDGLLARIEDETLRDAIGTEIATLRSAKDFGLVFERHIPENVALHSHPIRRGYTVQGRDGEGAALWHVARVRDGVAHLIDGEGTETEKPVHDLVVVRQFRDPIYPGLEVVGTVERGGDKPFHTVINGENYHALELLTYAYEGQIDAIYVDPPYNTGARDWKYNNDYVDDNDRFRHSKWLSFMEKRLRLAKRLLNPDDSVLIVTIDEKEFLRLGMLLEQVFPDQDMQMISTVINPSGSSRQGRFARADEYVFFVMFGDAVVVPWTSDMLRNPSKSAAKRVRWNGLIRNGEGSRRGRIPSLFYPIFIHEDTGLLHSVGEPLAADARTSSVECPPGTLAVLPIDGSGQELMWRLYPPSLRSYFEKGYARLSRRDPKTGLRSPQYLQKGTIEKLEAGDIFVTGKDEEGALELTFREGAKTLSPLTTWNRVSHSAAEHGSAILKRLIPGRKFPFPKSLYAVEDALRFFVGAKPDAVVLDFFVGSGTTMHAVARLNRQDGGRRRSIVVTNNEVSVVEAERLRKAGHAPGDPEWEALGIFEHITQPRVTAAVTGCTPDGEPIDGDYKFTDEFPMSDGFAENVQFAKLTYLDRNDIDRGKQFGAITPLLWMRAGSSGDMIVEDSDAFAAPSSARYAVLFDVAHGQAFADAIAGRDDLEHIYVVTDSLAQFQQIVAELPQDVEVSMLYEDYLRNFEINTGGQA